MVLQEIMGHDNKDPAFGALALYYALTSIGLSSNASFRMAWARTFQPGCYKNCSSKSQGQDGNADAFQKRSSNDPLLEVSTFARIPSNGLSKSNNFHLDGQILILRTNRTLAAENLHVAKYPLHGYSSMTTKWADRGSKRRGLSRRDPRLLLALVSPATLQICLSNGH